MHLEIAEEIVAAREVARKFAERQILPFLEKDYEEGVVRREIVQAMGELGFFGCLFPEEYGGTKTGYLSGVAISEEISKVSASYGGCFISQLAGPSLAILRYGNEEQKESHIPGIISGKQIAVFAATEPDAGSDLLPMRSTAVDKGDCYVLNGTKTWITNAVMGDIGLIWVYTNKGEKHRGMSCFIVDMKNTEGIRARTIEKMGLRCSEAGELVLEDVKVPKKNLLGNLGDGYEILMYTLSNTRLFAASRALGVAEACLEASSKYAKERVQFGHPISEFQMIQDQLVQVYVENEAAKLLVYQVAMNKDKGINDITELATAKYFACEAGLKAAMTAMRVYSSYGYSLEYPIHRWVRDALAFPITEGTSNIQKKIIAKSIFES
jgi:glutaryl-CoA dehydrogenase (non-decarboxylating)